MTTAAEADKRAAEIEFLRNIDQHAFDDAKGIAPKHISEKLRSDRFVNDWGSALASLTAKVTDKGHRACINERRIEAAQARRIFHRIADANTSTIQKTILELTGIHSKGQSLHEINCELLTMILVELKAMNKK
jgi:hypothetical protein